MRILLSALILLSSLSGYTQETPSQPKPVTRPPAFAAGSITNNIYRNSDLGIVYKIILGWVDRTTQIQDPEMTGRVLLATFEHPPEVKGDAINSAVIIAEESLASYPGIKTSAEYFGMVTEAATSQGFKVVNEPYSATVGSKTLVRSDFSKETGKVTMYQSSLVTLNKGYAVSFTVIGGSEDEVEQLVARLSFDSPTLKR